MTNQNHPDSLQLPRFSGIRTFMRLPHHRDLSHSDVAILGIPFDTGSSYDIGSRFGPQSIRDASTILKPFNSILKINVLEKLKCVDYGDITVVPGYIERSFDLIEKELTEVLNSGAIFVALGGDHSITLPELRAINKKFGKVALVHFDAHSDTGDLYFGEKYNHGTTFRRAIEEELILAEKSVQIGIRGPLYSEDQFDFAIQSGIRMYDNWTIQERGLDNVITELKKHLTGTPIFISFDIDFLDASYAPGTGTPEICGFTTFEAQKLLLKALTDLEIVGCDLVEVLPANDSPGKITSYAAAGIVFDLLSLIALYKAK